MSPDAFLSLCVQIGFVLILFSLLLGWMIFADTPTRPMLSGAALVILAGLIIILRERQLGLRRARQRKAVTLQG